MLRCYKPRQLSFIIGHPKDDACTNDPEYFFLNLLTIFISNESLSSSAQSYGSITSRLQPACAQRILSDENAVR